MNNRISQEPSITAELYKSVKLSYNTLFNKEKSLLIKSQEVKL